MVETRLEALVVQVLSSRAVFEAAAGLRVGTAAVSNPDQTSHVPVWALLWESALASCVL